MRTFVIPDVHQDIGFVERCLYYADPHDEIVFLGDYLDTRKKIKGASVPDGIVGTKATLRYLDGLRSRFEKITYLVGNHDAHYLYDLFGRAPYNPLICGGYSRSKASKVKRYVSKNPETFFTRMMPFAAAGGFLLSHAGISSSIVPFKGDPEDFQLQLGMATGSLRTLQKTVNLPYWWIGPLRGGFDREGGIIWQDLREFHDDQPYPQVFGHTSGAEIRTIGRSHCIDCSQRAFAIITDGRIRFHKADEMAHGQDLPERPDGEPR